MASTVFNHSSLINKEAAKNSGGFTRMFPWASGIVDRIRKRRQSKDRRVSFTYNDEGVTWTSRIRNELEIGDFIPWTDIKRIVAFKRDMYAYDLMCISIETSGYVYEIDEEKVNWSTFVRELPTHLPGALDVDAWYETVRLPPFETNRTVLYSREGDPEEMPDETEGPLAGGPN